ncbi:MAG: hypothetical protein ACYTGQ_18495 [Planctomycetota bacterium]|jgi:hypothetical protein
MRNLKRLAAPVLGLWIVSMGLAGCSRPISETANPTAIPTTDYDRVFDAAVKVLRENHFVVDRADRRFGVVTTEPRIASSVFEPWHTDNLNMRRRTARVRLSPRTADRDSDYQLYVEVTCQTRHLPTRELNTAAMGNIHSRNVHNRHYPVRTEAGLDEAYWLDSGVDERLSARLVEQILDEARSPDVRWYKDEDESS